MRIMDAFRITVVIPAFNCEGYIREAMGSVCRQSVDGFEIVVVDDGSRDGTLGILKEMGSGHAMRILTQSNQGPAAAMNAGIGAASGDWIVVMHGDDVMKPDRLKVLAEAMESVPADVGIISAAVELVSEDGRSLGRARPELPRNPFYLGDDDTNFIVGGLYHTALRRSMLEQVGGYDASCRLNEDVELYNRCVEAGYGVLVLDECLMEYRIHGGAASSAAARRLLEHWRFLKLCIRSRRGGRPIPGWEEYLEMQRQRPLLSRMNVWRKDSAKIYYRRAASALSSRSWLDLGLCSVASVALQPGYFLSKWRSRRR